ncbi:MAG: YHS domain-containing protein, partial [Pseudolabrys sp.]
MRESGHSHNDGTMTDPVCGMSVDPQATQHHAEHRGQNYFFCSAGCKTKFAADPQKYLAPRAPGPPVKSAIYICPMHPQIRQQSPGACPICGMALEPEMPTADSGPNPELADMTRRFWIGLAFGVPVMTLEMRGHFGAHWLSPALSNDSQFVFATPVVLWAGWPYFVRGAQSLATRNLNMFTLIAMGTGVAYVYSAVATLAPGLFPEAFRGHGAPAVYFEAASMITVLVLIGQVLELRAREATSGAIRALHDLAPKTARRVTENGSDEEISLDRVHVGDKLRVRPGDK